MSLGVLFYLHLVTQIPGETGRLSSADNKDQEYTCEGVYYDEMISSSKAIEIAIKELQVRYGNQEAKDGEPYSAEMIQQIWVVKGYRPPEFVGGSFIVYVNAHTGCVIAINPAR